MLVDLEVLKHQKQGKTNLQWMDSMHVDRHPASTLFVYSYLFIFIFSADFLFLPQLIKTRLTLDKLTLLEIFVIVDGKPP